MMKDLGRRISATHCNGLGMLPFSVTLRPKGARGGAAEAIGEFVNLQSTQFQVSLSRKIAGTLDEERSLSALSTAPDLSTMFAGGAHRSLSFGAKMEMDWSRFPERGQALRRKIYPCATA